ncbi:reverse transcriptase domain-containing protein, partial [Escherichia coli]
MVKKIKDLEVLKKKRVKLETSIVFLKKCRDQNVIPKCARLTFRFDIRNSAKILEKASVKLLKQLIKNAYSQLNQILLKLYTMRNNCIRCLSENDFDKIDKLTYEETSRLYATITAKHKQKLQCLIRQQKHNCSSNVEKRSLSNTVINLSNITLDKDTQSVLEKGMNFAITPKQIPYENIISNIEESITRNKIPTADAETVRQDVAVILRKSKLPKANVTFEERKALQQLRSDKDIIVLKADKGNATVIMNTSDYEEKVKELLNDRNTYKLVSYNPTARIYRNTRALIDKNRENLSEDIYNHLHQTQIIQPPKLYGLPKIHKINVPLRPIVSQINAPTYRLAKHLSSLLQPLVGKTTSFVKDSRHFVEILKDLQLQPDELLVSFDVVSLFTNVPLDDCLEVINSNLNVSDHIIDLLKHCLEGTFFLYKNQYYLQIDGVAMGSPIAPVIANIWMEYFEQKALTTGPPIIKLWKRYVDDIFCIIKGGLDEINQYLSHLNSIHPKIQFTFEMEKDRSLAFLDVLVKVKPNGSLAHTVYRKPTHTDRYLNASSHHHPRHLDSVKVSLTKRAKDLCDSE